MAEAFLNYLAGDRFVAESAGLEPGILNPVVIEVMQEARRIFYRAAPIHRRQRKFAITLHRH